MCNFTSFKEEAKGMLTKVYSRHKTGVNAMVNVPVWPILSSKVCMLLKSMLRMCA